MAFPPAVYTMLVEHFKQMAALAPEQEEADGTILVRVAGRDASINVSARRTDAGGDELVLRFPGKPTAKAAT